MTSKEIRNLILNYEMSEELLWEYIETDFYKAVVGILNGTGDLAQFRIL